MSKIKHTCHLCPHQPRYWNLKTHIARIHTLKATTQKGNDE